MGGQRAKIGSNCLLAGPYLQRCNYDNLSKNDRRFLEFMEREAARIDGHYQLTLPLKDREVVLHNNMMVAMKHMKSLKKRFDSFTISTNVLWIN